MPSHTSQQSSLERAREAALRVASLAKARPEGEGIQVFRPLGSPQYFFREASGPGYLVTWSPRLGGFLVYPGRRARRFGGPGWPAPGKVHLVREERVFRLADLETTGRFLVDFLARRLYPVDDFSWRRVRRLPFYESGVARFSSAGHRGVFLVSRLGRRFRGLLTDEEAREPYFCAPRSQFRFSFRSRVPVGPGGTERLQALAASCEEVESETTRRNFLYPVKKSFYGLHSPNLRSFFADNGLMPEARYTVLYIFLFTIAAATVTASVFVRVAERLEGNTWYTMAAGVLIFLRIPFEVLNTRRARRLTRHLPSSRLLRTSRSESFRLLTESRPMRLWSSFESVLLDFYRQADYLPEKIEAYRLLKPGFTKLVAEGRHDEALECVAREMGLSQVEKESLEPFVMRLEPLDYEATSALFASRLAALRKAGLARESEWPSLENFLRDLPGMLDRYSVGTVHNLFNDLLKKSERVARREEILSLVTRCRRALVPYRRIELGLLVSFFLTGYAATYAPRVPDLVFPLFYIFHGLMLHVLASGLERFSNPYWMQYIFKEMENDPAISSAADAWNEITSQHMRVFTLGTSLGIILGLGGRILAPLTGNISRFAIDLAALGFHLAALHYWYLFVNGMIGRCRHTRRAGSGPAGAPAGREAAAAQTGPG